ncbi:hypothetical protein [Emticicia sp. 17c]|uniref:hypothetical protein n=1 Tax=Emticicia sp. 17c TaxID=3127704 RepID=UPI00301DD72C
MKRFLQLFICWMIAYGAFAQDSKRKTYLYLNNGAGFVGKIEKVPEEGKISFSIDNGGTRTYQKSKVVAAFNEFGRYLVISSLPDSPDAAKVIIDKFYNTQSSMPEHDVIFRAVPFDIIPCTIMYNKESINYQNLKGERSSINKDNVLVVVHRDGSHEIIGSIEEVAPILETNSDKFNSIVNKTTNTHTPINPKPIVKPNIKPKPDSLKIPVAKTNGKATKLSSEEKETYAKQSIDYVVKFKDYLEVIGNKNKSSDERNKAIKEALELFTPGATIEITSKTRGTTATKTVEKYLKDLKNLSYSTIDIEYANLRFVSELSQASDGNYYGLVRGEQSFVGFGANGKALYSDVVDKNYKVKLESFTSNASGESKVGWKVLLGDVTVSQEKDK